MSKIIIKSFTDPVCIWCWASEPILRALETHYPGQIKIKNYACGLVENIDNFNDSSNRIDGGSIGANKQIMKHWLDSVNIHKMPVREEGFKLFSKEFPSTFPQNIAYKAVEMIKPQKANKFLRLLREATITQAIVTGDEKELIELARIVGINISEFKNRLDDGSALLEFKRDRQVADGYSISSFPTFIISIDSREAMIRGYQSFDSFNERIINLSNGDYHPIEIIDKEKTFFDLLENHPKLFREEIRVALDFDEGEEIDKFLEVLLEDSKIKKINLEQSYYIEKNI